jgi:nitroimidazol reductase NimA-like FMN-containing flavoprotein (pyridoxamine 5'-phosphate oxidase superfamily)
MSAQGSLDLLNDPVAEELLAAPIPARLAYTWTDGTPRVVPIWFHWTGDELVMGTPLGAPKLKALQAHPEVAVTIDDNTWPHKVLMLRGKATIERKDDIDENYAKAADKYFGPEQGAAWVAQLRGQPMARVGVRPEWVGIIDFQTRFPSALSS